METWEFLNDVQKLYAINLDIKEDEARIINPNNGKCVNIYREKYYSQDGKDVFIEYIVCFATQHRHLEDLDEVEEYVHSILKDEILAIEFYDSDERKFGGEIEKADLAALSLNLLAKRWGYSIEYLPAKEYEIHSWSGKYDSERKNVADINPKLLKNKEDGK